MSDIEYVERLLQEAKADQLRERLQLLLDLMKQESHPDSESVTIVDLSDPDLPAHEEDIAPLHDLSAALDHEPPMRLYDAKLTTSYVGGGLRVGGVMPSEFVFTSRIWRARGIPAHLRDHLPLDGLDRETGVAQLRPNLDIEAMGGPAFHFMGTNNTLNFGHFIHDLLGQLVYVDASKARSGEKLRFTIPVTSNPAFRYPIMRLMFDALIGDERDIVYLDRNVRFEHGYFADPAFLWFDTEPVVNEPAFRYLNRRIRATFGGEMNDDRRRLYIARGTGTNPRVMENEDAAEAIFVKHGFEVIVVQEMDPLEIISAFGGAEIIAGVHGAGLMNYVFASPGHCKVVELDTHPAGWRSVREVGTAMGFEYALVPGSAPTRPESKGRIDLDYLESVLRQWH